MQIQSSVPHCIYLVGGAVRDSLMDLKPHDYDYVVVASSLLDVRQVVESIEGAIVVHEDARYGLIRAKINKDVVDFVMARCDGAYTDHRHCDSVRPGTLLEDLSRRDFTVNAIAIDTCSNMVHDPYNGADDVATKTLKCVGNANERLSEDPLRILRALRLMITHGLAPDSQLQMCLRDSAIAQMISYVSADRLRQELQRCTQHNVQDCLNLLVKYPHLLSAILKKVTIKWQKNLIL